MENPDFGKRLVKSSQNRLGDVDPYEGDIADFHR